MHAGYDLYHPNNEELTWIAFDSFAGSVMDSETVISEQGSRG